MSELQVKPARLSVATSLSEDAFPDFSDPNLFSTNSPESPLAAQTPSDSGRSSIASSFVVSPGASSGVASASSGSKILLPLPTPSSNISQTSFALSEVGVNGEEFGLGSLPAEIATADISISGM